MKKVLKMQVILVLSLLLVMSLGSIGLAQDTAVIDGKTVKLSEAPLNLVVKPGYIEVPDTGIKFPYFEVTWENPASVVTLMNTFTEGTFYIGLDYRIKNDRWQSEFWEEKTDYSGNVMHPSEKKLIFYTQGIVEEKDETYVAEDFEIRLCYVYLYGYSDAISSPYTTVVKQRSFEGASPWAVDELNKATELGFITDKIKGKMNGPISREEFAELAVIFYEKASGIKAVPAPVNTFADTMNPEILKAFQLKITNGAGKDPSGKDIFKPTNSLNRQEMAAMITRSLNAVYATIDLSSAGVSAFADEKSIASWALDSAKFMKKYKITEGIGNNQYGPTQTCTREQAVIFLTRAYLKTSEYTIK